MSCVSEKAANEIISEINYMISTYEDSLKNLEEMEHTLCSNATALAGYNGARVTGSSRSESTEDYTKYYYDKFSIKGANEIVSSSNSIMNETDRLQTSVESLINQTKDMDNSLSIIAIYIANIELGLESGFVTSKKPYSKMNMLDKLKCAREFMENDKKYGCSYLNKSPIIKQGFLTIPLKDSNGRKIYSKYLEFYNKYGVKTIAPFVKVKYFQKLGMYYFTKMSDAEIKNYIAQTTNYHNNIMITTGSYSDNFRKLAVDPLKQITFEYIDYDKGNADGSNWVAYTKTNENIVFDMKCEGESPEMRKFMLESYSHELGHSCDYSLGSSDYFSNGDEFADIYNQINKNDSQFEHIREYGHTSAIECFAEATMLYYNHPQSLMEIEIDGHGVNNLYEYMKNILE